MASIPWPFGVYPFPCFGNNFHSMTSQYVPEDTTNLEWNPPNTVEEPKSNDSRKPKRKSSEKSSSHSSSEQKADSRERTHKRSKPQHRR